MYRRLIRSEQLNEIALMLYLVQVGKGGIKFYPPVILHL